MSPYFEYACEKCQHVTTEFVTFNSRKDEIECEKCNGSAKLQMAVGTFTVKGYSAANNYSRTNKGDRK